MSFRLREIYDIGARLRRANIEGDGEWTEMKTGCDVKLMLVVGRSVPLGQRELLGSFDKSVCLMTWKDSLNVQKECLEIGVNRRVTAAF